MLNIILNVIENVYKFFIYVINLKFKIKDFLIIKECLNFLVLLFI